MPKRRSYKETKKLFNLPEQLCDRCGNDLLKGCGMIHLPYKKEYIHLCHICERGLMFSFWDDCNRIIKGGD